ncbi:D-alanyl-D-alanine carboxypeptidase [Anoxybacter fermentans]|uniref:serine-type D-Ala-D-Ala carboxypeptidase n=1 Tax=Anoxybacter fermentans TaxID=1323375 RepID=A0A3Q9HSS3_9FIRM|nr:D-alanyl-D-alanine carboxypeptidase family protein [Anoxybacter fermentans]AZR74574.1 D-alanyl-D-alanine carboxypeptidase [Anoxybacter fermentans]
MKRKLSLFISTVLLTIILGTGFVNAVEFDIPAKSAILIDAKTGQVLYEKEAHKKLPPASITKIMTLLLAMEAIERGEASLNDMVSISKRAESMGGSQIYLSTRDRLPLKTLLKAITVASANDACVAVAEYLGGTEENFVRMMNKRARELGMVNTHFVNSTGLPAENHYTTAYDISLMARELIKYKEIRKWARIWHETIQLHDGKRSITNTNTLIKSYPGIDGLKTGHTSEAGYCLVASVERDGFRLISVVMNTASEQQRNEASARLLDYGFRVFEHKVVVKENETVKDIPIQKGKKQTVDAYTAKSLQVVVFKGTSNQLRREIKPLGKSAPISKGEKVGELIVYQGEKELGRVDLLASEDVEKANIFILFFRWLWKLILDLIGQLKK